MEEAIKELQALEHLLKAHNYSPDGVMLLGLNRVIERLQALQQCNVSGSKEFERRQYKTGDVVEYCGKVYQVAFAEHCGTELTLGYNAERIYGVRPEDVKPYFR